MLKKALIILAFVLTTAWSCFAQMRGSSIATVNNPGKTGFTNLGVYGLDTTGNPGYIELSSAGTTHGPSSGPITYFLWVDNTGDLRLASYADIRAYASFPSGNWTIPEGFGAGVVVGGQS